MNEEVVAPPLTVYITWCMVRAVGSQGKTEKKEISIM